LFHLFVEHQTYQVPTLHALSKFGTGPGPEPGMEYMPRSIQRIMLNGQGRMDPALRADARIYYAQVLKLVAEMYRAGVPFMAGTDEPVPGFALHQDLEQFVKARLTPLQALEAATIVPARFLHRDDRAGSIAVGKDADLVLLDDDPTRDISNTTKIRAVVIRGELLDRAALDGMLARIKAAVN
jgi:imidazolonepropionase-like amidohydrolase